MDHCAQPHKTENIPEQHAAALVIRTVSVEIALMLYLYHVNLEHWFSSSSTAQPVQSSSTGPRAQTWQKLVSVTQPAHTAVRCYKTRSVALRSVESTETEF